MNSVDKINQNSETNKVLEYEVYCPPIEHLVPPLVCRSEDEANSLRAALTEICGRRFGSSCDWRVREVILNERPIPKWSVTPRAVTVEEGRRLAATHGQDRMIVLAWNAKDGQTNLVTIGSSRVHSDAALKAGNEIIALFGFKSEDFNRIEDRRHEHDTEPETQVSAPSDV
jgi:hypothetical protein